MGTFLVNYLSFATPTPRRGGECAEAGTIDTTAITTAWRARLPKGVDDLSHYVLVRVLVIELRARDRARRQDPAVARSRSRVCVCVYGRVRIWRAQGEHTAGH